MSTDGWMDKQNVVYTYNSILFSFKKEGNPVTCSQMDEPWGHYAKENKPVTKSQTLYDSTFMRYLNCDYIIETESEWLPEARGRGKRGVV